MWYSILYLESFIFILHRVNETDQHYRVLCLFILPAIQYSTVENNLSILLLLLFFVFFEEGKGVFLNSLNILVYLFWWKHTHTHIPVGYKVAEFLGHLVCICSDLVDKPFSRMVVSTYTHTSNARREFQMLCLFTNIWHFLSFLI